MSNPPQLSLRHAARLSLPTLIALGLAAGCSPAWFEADADREVALLLDEYDTRTLGDRASWVEYPEPLAEPENHPDPLEADEEEERIDDALDGPPETIDLARALELAFSSSRDYKTQRESLYLAGLGYSLTRYNFGPILDSTISYVWSDSEDGDASDSLGVDLRARQILPTGGDLTVDSSLGGDRFGDPGLLQFDSDTFYDSNVSVSLRQPLLRGAGYEVSHEPLTQGERNVIYAVRDFELFRQRFAIRITNDYYRLVSQRKQLDNDEQDYRDSVFDREKAEALRQVDRITQQEVLLARRRELESEDALLVSRTDFDLALDDFKIVLGLPPSRPVEIVDQQPPFEGVRLDPHSAVRVALLNRLDLHTERDQVDDTERRVRLAANNLLPNFDLSLGGGYDGAGDDLQRSAPDRWVASVGVAIEVPLDRKAERNAYRASLISLERARRNLDQRLDEVEADVLDRLRVLSQLEKRLQIQEDKVVEEERAVAVMQIRFESGDVEARDFLDARQALVDAQNLLIDLTVDHFIARLDLQRELGVLFIDDRGMWQE